MCRVYIVPDNKRLILVGFALARSTLWLEKGNGRATKLIEKSRV